MELFYKNVYSNLVQQKFSTPSNLISCNFIFEIKFEGVENLEDEAILKSFYFFLLVFGKIPAFKKFNSKYHLGKTIYNFRVFLTLKSLGMDLIFLDFLNTFINEPNKTLFNSSIFCNNLSLNLTDLKSFYLVESNPHFFKWEKELFINFSLISSLSKVKKSNLYFFMLQNSKSFKFDNFWSQYVV